MPRMLTCECAIRHMYHPKSEFRISFMSTLHVHNFAKNNGIQNATTRKAGKIQTKQSLLQNAWNLLDLGNRLVGHRATVPTCFQKRLRSFQTTESTNTFARRIQEDCLRWTMHETVSFDIFMANVTLCPSLHCKSLWQAGLLLDPNAGA